MAVEPRGLFAVPAPVRDLFKRFPLHVAPADALPVRSPDCHPSSRPRLYVFASDEDARRGRPSFNPSCLKWQTLLRIAKVDVELVSSSNHASPSGALPFLLPPPPSSLKPAVPLTGSKLHRYAISHGASKLQEDEPSRLEAYQALLVNKIRPAWVSFLLFPFEPQPLTLHSFIHSTYYPPTIPSSLVYTFRNPSSYSFPFAKPSVPPLRMRFSNRPVGLFSSLHSSTPTPRPRSDPSLPCLATTSGSLAHRNPISLTPTSLLIHISSWTSH
jgi:hypothetical protein